jgi:hypothetical protein
VTPSGDRLGRAPPAFERERHAPLATCGARFLRRGETAICLVALDATGPQAADAP